MITRFIESLRESLEPRDTLPDTVIALQRAVAVLLVDVAKADWVDEPEERRTIGAVLQSHFALGSEEAETLIDEAEKLQDIEASLHAHLATLNAQWSVEQRVRLVDELWSVAFADGELSKYEEHTIRRLANLLHVPHADFIKAKHRYSER